MEISEKQLEDLIFESDPAIIRKRGINGFSYRERLRQFNLGRFGRIDMITFGERKHIDDQLLFTIYELKKDEIDYSALAQICRYKEGLECCLGDFHDLAIFDFRIECVLIGKKVKADENFCYLLRSLRNVIVYTYDIDINGLSFNHFCPYEYTSAPEGDNRGFGDAETLNLNFLAEIKN